MCTYQYIRVSTRKQNPLRQYKNMESYCRDHNIKVTKTYEDKFTGTTTDRPEFNRLKKRVAANLLEGKEVTIIFDSVSRMSRDATEGVKQYFEWFDSGVNLIFMHEPSINTETYRQSLREIGMTGTDADLILEGVNKFLRKLATNQIIQAFEQAEKEARDIKSRVVEGLEAEGFKSTTAEFTRIPQNNVEVTDIKVATSIMRLIDRLEELDDVQNVYANFDIPDEILQQLEV